MQGCLKQIIDLMISDGPARETVAFCMASTLATLVLDDDVMLQIKQRGEAPIMFEHCIEILKQALHKLNNSPDPGMDAKLAEEIDMTVKMAEACAQAMWGAAYYCTLPDGGESCSDFICKSFFFEYTLIL